MTTFILIIFFRANGLAVTTQEFNSQKSCIAASELVLKKFASTVDMYCVPK